MVLVLASYFEKRTLVSVITPPLQFTVRPTAGVFATPNPDCKQILKLLRIGETVFIPEQYFGPKG